MLRLFIGIPLPESHQGKLQVVAGQLNVLLQSTVRWINPGNGHLTLKFLGMVDEDRLDDLISTLSAIDFPAFDIGFDGCSYYPDTAHPRVVWMPVNKGARLCERLAATLETLVTDIGFSPNAKPFKPHLTLGRVKKNAPDNWEACLRSVDTRNWPGFRVDRFVLWQSDLTPDGPVYTPLHTVLLKKAVKG